MKTIEYKAPEMEVIEMKNKVALLNASAGGDSQGEQGEGDMGGGTGW